MEGAGKLVWLDKIEIIHKNYKQKLHNELIDVLQQKGVSWMKENVLLEGKPFLTQMVDILWRLDGHHGKFAAQSCLVYDVFSIFQTTMYHRIINERGLT